MGFQINWFIIPVLIPFIMAGKAFMEQQDFKVMITELVSKRTLIFTMAGLMLSFALQVFMGGKLI